MVYLPGANPASVKFPSLVVVSVFVAPFASVATTVAPTITPPNSSVTEPFSEPAFRCAKAAVAQSKTIKRERFIKFSLVPGERAVSASVVKTGGDSVRLHSKADRVGVTPQPKRNTAQRERAQMSGALLLVEPIAGGCLR